MLINFKLFESFRDQYPLYSILKNENSDLFFVLDNLKKLHVFRFAETDYDNNIIDDGISFIDNIPFENVDNYYIFEEIEKTSIGKFLQKYKLLIDYLFEKNIGSEFIEKYEIKKYMKINKFNL